MTLKPAPWNWNPQETLFPDLAARCCGGIAAWEAVGTSSFDIARQNDAPFVGDPIWAENESGVVIDHLDSVNRYVNLGTSADLAPPEVGLIWWGFKRSQGSSFGACIERDYFASSEPFYVYRLVLGRNADNNGVFSQFNLNGVRQQLDSGPDVVFNDTEAVVVLSIRDGSQRMWAQGALQASKTLSGTIVDYGQETRVGAAENNNAAHRGQTYLAMIFRDGITDDEAFAVMDNPAGLITQREQTPVWAFAPTGVVPPSGPFGPLYDRNGQLQSLTGGTLAA